MNDIMAIPCTSSDFPAILQESDDDSWLYDGDTELTSALLERQKEMEAYEMRRASRKQSNKNAAADHETSNQDSPKRGLKEPSFDLAGLAQSMQAFVTKASSYEGAEVPDGMYFILLLCMMVLKVLELTLVLVNHRSANR
jgi:hypothetical protein